MNCERWIWTSEEPRLLFADKGHCRSILRVLWVEGD